MKAIFILCVSFLAGRFVGRIIGRKFVWKKVFMKRFPRYFIFTEWTDNPRNPRWTDNTRFLIFFKNKKQKYGIYIFNDGNRRTSGFYTLEECERRLQNRGFKEVPYSEVVLMEFLV